MIEAIFMLPAEFRAADQEVESDVEDEAIAQ